MKSWPANPHLCIPPSLFLSARSRTPPAFLASLPSRSVAHSSSFPCILTNTPSPATYASTSSVGPLVQLAHFGGLLPSPVRYPQCSRRYGGLPPNFVHHKSSPHLDPSFRPSFPFALLCPILNLTHSFIYVNSAKLTRGFYLCFSRALFTDKPSTYIKTIQRRIHIGPKKF